MFQRVSKKAISGLIALSVALSVYIAKPVDVSADSNLQADTVYTVTNADYVQEDSDLWYSRPFVPANTGYYMYEGNMYDFYLYEFDEYGYYDGAADGYDATPIDMDFVIETYPITRKNFYLEAGKTYYLRHCFENNESYDYGKFSLRTITNYFLFSATPAEEQVAAIKNKTFTCSVNINTNAQYNDLDITYNWFLFGEHVDGNSSQITLNSNDYFDFSGDLYDAESFTYNMYCQVVLEYEDSTYYKYVYFEIKPYKSLLAANTWATNDDDHGAQEYDLTYQSSYYDYYQNIRFAVDAGSSIDCSITYSWYEVDLNKESSGVVDKTELYIPVSGETSKVFTLKDQMNNPYFVVDDEGRLNIRKQYVCVVTFTSNDESFQREVPFDLIYSPDVRYSDYSSRTRYVKKGDTITLPKKGEIYETELPAGVSMSYSWVNFLDKPEYTGVSYVNSKRDIFENIELDNTYNLLNVSGKSASIDTSKLTWLNIDGKKVSYVVIAYQPYFNNVPCIMDNGYFAFELVDITGLPMGDYVSANYLYRDNRTISINDHLGDIFYVEADAFDGCDISYQWYKIDSDKERSGNYTNREELYIPIEGMTGSVLSGNNDSNLMKKLGDPYLMFDDENIGSIYMDIVCVVTFSCGNETVTKEVPFKLYFASGVYHMGMREVSVKSTDKVLMPDSCGVYDDEPVDYASINDSSCPGVISYKYTWIGFNTLEDFEIYDLEGHSYPSTTNVWSRISSDYTVIGTGKSATLNMSDLTKFPHLEDKFSFVACVYEPVYNGNVIRCKNVSCGYIPFKITYTDLVTPDTNGIAVNAENFPDAKFRQYVSENIDKNHSGYISDSELNNLYTIDISNLGISDLTGIEYFKYIFNLHCAGNNLTTLNLTGFENLEYLDCSSNKITSLIIPDSVHLYTLYCRNNNLSALNLSVYSNLSSIDCSNNNMTSLTLPSNSNIILLIMNGNRISTLDISNYSKLKGHYQSAPYYRISSGVTAYGYLTVREYTINNRIRLQAGLQIDDSTTVLNATPSSNAGVLLFDVNATQVENGIKLEWDAVAGAKRYTIHKMPCASTYTNEYDLTDESFYIDNEVNEGTEYTYIVVAFDEAYNAISFSKWTNITYSPVAEPIKITQQPEDYIGLEGTTAKFSVVAEGEGLTYQWQLKKGKSWSNLSSGGATTSTMSVKADASKNGKIYRCLITDVNGNELASNEVTITIKEPSIKINTQPQSFSGPEGSTAKFTVAAEGEGLAYQWQLKKGKSWANLSAGGATTSTMSIKVDSSKNGKVYRCLITDANGEELATDEVSITVKAPSINILNQPSSFTGTVGSTATFKVVAEGEGLSYQWQLKKGKSWANLSSGGATTSTMTINVDDSKNGKVYRCLITNGAEEELATNEVSVTVKEPDIIISEQPINQYAIESMKVTFHVEAEGEGLTYQWQLKKGKSWANLTSGGATTDTMTIKVDSGKFGKIYRCVITNSAGEQVVTDEVTINELTDHTDPPIIDNPEQTGTTNGEEGPVITPADPAQPNNASEPVTESPTETEVPEEVTAPVQAPAPVEEPASAPAEEPAEEPA